MVWAKEKMALPLLFSLTLFMSAFLMFTVQPMAGKMLTPLFGGSPSTWLAAMVFFQINLLVGYGLAFLLSHVTLRNHILIVLCLLAAGWFFQPLVIANEQEVLPVGFRASFKVLLILFGAVSVPFIALSSLSPSLQRLFAGTKQDPYFLFAASNLGSFGGLFAYPFVLEYFTGLHFQITLWQWGYVVLFALCVFCLWCAEKKGVPTTKAVHLKAHKPVSYERILKWVFLAFVPSSLMMGVTAHITTDTGSVPFFWVLPLGLYLMTFVQAFAKEKNLSSVRKLFFVQTVLVAIYFVLPALLSGILDVTYGILLGLLVFYISAWLYHTMLSALRPEPNYLTQFYLWVSLGGALGGVFNSFIAPFLFFSAIEFQLLLILSIMGSLFVLLKDKALYRSLLLYCALFVLVFVALSLSPSLGLTETLEVRRNFFGVIRVVDRTTEERTVRRLIHGTTVHGMQQVKPSFDLKPTSYYGPLGNILGSVGAQNVGMIGLGAGATLCHTAPRRYFTVYEIDKDVVDIAKKHFTFVKECGDPKIIIGDGRKLLEKEKAQRFDALIIDAFSSDAIPLHLLTQEAMQLYFDRVQKNGLVVLHISNRFFDLIPQLSAQMKALRIVGGIIEDDIDKTKRQDNPLLVDSTWVVLARDQQVIKNLRAQAKWKDLEDTEARAWTDDFSNMLSALRFIKPSSKDGKEE